MPLGDIVIVKPVNGLQVPINDSKEGSINYLPEVGKKVVLDRYWNRRKKAGEVTVMSVAAPSPKRKPKKGDN